MDKAFHALRKEIGEKDALIKMSQKEIMKKDEETRALRKKNERLEVGMSTLAKTQDKARAKEHALNKEIDRLKEVYAIEAKASKRRLSALQDEVACKDWHMKGLNCELVGLKTLCSQEAKEKKDAKASVRALSQDIKVKNLRINKLKSENVELKEQISFLESKLGKSAQQQNCYPSEQQPVNPTASENGVLGAVLGVAVGVGIAGAAAMLRR